MKVQVSPVPGLAVGVAMHVSMVELWDTVTIVEPEAGKFVPVTVSVKEPVRGIWLGAALVSVGLGAVTA